ncbi:hypothetical protein [Actinoplanes siamensis]|uniref:Uncharacterized protein n=1 Tax=Actinoplanes siamensis TaxID=1223317 RepID=A0A919NCP1_9ACTN|nr:hypothetical protein [Actinoplanes siamensis]GIF08779.1 hypothetical protein Asi03nite_63170 [Actinoplanes siamensis]
MTTQETQQPQTADQRNPDTEFIAVAAPAPVFVDSTGRRSRLLRRIALGFGILVVSYGGLVSVSLAGGPVSSSAVLPLPGVDDADQAAPVPPRPSPAPAAVPSGSPERPAAEPATGAGRQPVQQRTPVTARPVASTRATPATTPAKTAATTPTPTPSTPKPSTTTKPTESTTTPAADPAPTKAPDPVPPAVGAKGQPAALPTLGAPAGPAASDGTA